ncbi:MAG: hypothetical protein HY360_17380 [Verrucomicrobia bacterium]|nr:hypothetical protein [Verrucomicrobiota bacterium]
MTTSPLKTTPARNCTTTIDVGSRRQLFIDDRFIAEQHGISLCMNQPDTLEPVNLAASFLGVRGRYACVVEHHKQFFLYYDMLNGIEVAVSADGQNWTHPVADPLVLPGVGSGAVFVDPKPSDGCPLKATFQVDDAKRWGLDPEVTGRSAPTAAMPAAALGGLYLFRSENGLDWGVVPEMAVPFNCDTQNQAFYHSRLGKYAAYLRGFPEPEGMRHRNKRIVVRTEMSDLLDMPWPFTPNPANKPKPPHRHPHIADEMETVLTADENDPPTTDLYNPCMHLYPYAEDVFFAFPSMYRSFDHVPSYGRDLRGTGCNTGLHEVHLCVSRDGHTFNRFRSPYVSNGLIHDRKGFRGEPDCGLVTMCIGMIRDGDRLYQYYHGTGRIHGGSSVAKDSDFPVGALFRVRQRLDGFVSAEANYAGGELLTPPLTFAGNRLCLNADCGGLGEIWVEIQDAAGAPIPGHTMDDAVSIDRNGTSQEVWWKTGPDVALLAGRPVRLRLRMRSAKLYAFQFVFDSRSSAQAQQEFTH